jgi:hypothetical protein
MSIVLAILASALVMSLIVAVRYLIVSGAFAAATRLRYPGLYRGMNPQIRREIWWSIVSAAIYGIPAGVIAWGWQNHGWTLVYQDLHAYRCCSTSSRTTRGSTGRIAGCTSRARSSWRMRRITKAARRPPGRRWRSIRSRRSAAL